jgi:hypothetical protein
MKNFTLLFLLIVANIAYSQASLPVDFESTTITYEFSDFGGGTASVVDNPQSLGINTSTKVGQMIKFEGEVFGGSTLALNGPIDFAGNNAIKMKVFANRVDAPVLFKLEGPMPTEVSMNTTVANEWEELTFNFSGLTGAEYTGITIIYDLGIVGDGSENFTLLFDDMELTTATGGVQIPIDFESTTLNYVFSDFGGGVASVIDNPQSSGANTSAKVGQMIKFEGEVFGGSTLALGGAIDFAGNNSIKMKVLANKAGGRVLFKLEGPAPTEREVMTTVANEWEELTFNFEDDIPGVYNGITLIYDLGVVGDGSDDFTFLFDDIVLANEEVQLSEVDLPITFENPDIDYDLTDFDGTASMIVLDPTDANNMVVQTIKTTSAQPWAGTTASDIGLTNPIPFEEGSSKMTVRVWSPDAGIQVRLKVEKTGTPEISVETEATTTVAMDWETLEFDFSNEAMGTAAINYSNIYDKVTIFFNFATSGADAGEKTYYWDDVQFGGISSVKDQTELNEFVKLSPNPADNFLNINFLNKVNSIINLSVYDSNGRIVKTNKLTNNTSLDISNINSGIYLLRLDDGDSVYFQRVVIQH